MGIDEVRFQDGIAVVSKSEKNRRNTADGRLIQITHKTDLTISPAINTHPA
jgi:hypothetical protein